MDAAHVPARILRLTVVSAAVPTPNSYPSVSSWPAACSVFTASRPDVGHGTPAGRAQRAEISTCHPSDVSHD